MRPTDDGLKRPDGNKVRPLPGFTASRLNRAVQFLVDLGLATWEHPHIADGDDEDDRRWIARISVSGRNLLEVLRG